MANFSRECTSSVIPCLRYREAHKAIEWLCAALGFERKAVYANADGSVAHAQLTFGNGMVMVGSAAAGTVEDNFYCQPDEINRKETQYPCLLVSDCDAVYKRVKAVGGEVVVEIADVSYGGRSFTCRDPGGHLWYVGSYDPWATSDT
jgi:uncharacterized glyoxalase superfamily protein PhnB